MSDNQQSTVTALAATHDAATMMGFQNLAAFEFMQRAAKLFASSTMVPAAYQAVVSEGYGRDKKWVQNDAALPNCMVALDLAQRMNASPLQVMQNLHVIEGRPSWGSPFIIALINNSGLYAHNLRFKFEWLDEVDAKQLTFEWINNVKTEVVKTVRIQNARCVAWTKDKTGELVESPPVTLEMAVQEGWYTRNGSKWKTMPQVMAQYRAAAFFGRTYNPELLMGLPTAEELHDIIDVVPQADGSLAMQSNGDAQDAARTPRAPRAKAAPAAAEVVEPVQTPAPSPAPEPAAEAPAPAPAPAPAAEATPPSNVPGVDMATGEVLDASIDTRTRNLFEPEPVADPAPEPTSEKITSKRPVRTPAPAAAATPEPEKQAAKAPAGPPLAASKIAFVKAQLDTTGGKTTDQFKEQFGIEPDALTVPLFPSVLEWLKAK